MPVNLTRNSKPMDGVTSITIEGDVATVEVETGSEADGFLYYSYTRQARPRFGLQLQEGKRPKINRRFLIEHAGGNTYRLHGGSNMES